MNTDCVLLYFLNVGASPRESRKNLLAWLDSIIFGCSATAKKSMHLGEIIEGSYEGLSCAEVNKVTCTRDVTCTLLN